MEGASHAHVPDYRETAPERKAAQLDVRLARVVRIRVSDELESFGSASRMSSVTKGCSRSRTVDSFRSERAVDALEGGAATPEATGAAACCEVVPKLVDDFFSPRRSSMILPQ